MTKPIIPNTPPEDHKSPLREIEHDLGQAKNVEDVPAPPALTEA
jgi:hypothetical protein